MTEAQIKEWVELLENCCADVPAASLNFIIDQAGTTPLLSSVCSVVPALTWQSLFDGLPEEGSLHLAPVLVRVDLTQPLQRQWLIGLIGDLHDRSRLLFLVTRWHFPSLAEYLRRCLGARHRGRGGLFRFYDPRVFALLFSHVFGPDQQQVLLRPAEFWSWLDRDGQPRHLPGASDLPQPPDDFTAFELTDSQLERLSCVSDAMTAQGNFAGVLPSEWTTEQRFHACYEAVLEALAAGHRTGAELAAQVRKKLRGA